MVAALSPSSMGPEGQDISPRLAASIARHHRWGLTPRQRRRLRVEMLKIATQSGAETCRIGAARVLLQMDALDSRRERTDQDGRIESAQLALDAVRTQLAAQLAAGAAGLPGQVIPEQQLAATPIPATPSVQLPEIGTLTAACPVGRCDGSGYVVSDAGATPCDCSRPPPQQSQRHTPEGGRRERRGRIAASLAKPAEPEGPVDPADMAY